MRLKSQYDWLVSFLLGITDLFGPLSDIGQIMRLDTNARAGRKYRIFFAQLVMKPSKMAINSPSWTKIGGIFCSARILIMCLRVQNPHRFSPRDVVSFHYMVGGQRLMIILGWCLRLRRSLRALLIMALTHSAPQHPKPQPPNIQQLKPNACCILTAGI